MTVSARARRTGVSILIGAFVATLATACAGADATDQATDDDPFWAPLRIVGDEVESYATLSEMSDAADVVARGRITDFAVSRVLTTDTTEDLVTYAAMSFAPDEVLSGSVESESLPVEFIVNTHPDEASETIETQAANLPEQEIMVFLRAKRGDGEAGLYRLVNGLGLWTVIDGTVTAPLAVETGAEEHPYQAELEAVSTLDDLGEVISDQG